jgi:hypothetical protein
MKLDFLPSPGLLPSGPRLQAEMTKACSYVETMASMKGGLTEQAQSLTRFCTAVNTAIAGFRDVTLPTYVSGAFFVAAAPKTVTLTYSEPLDQTVLPAAGSWVLSQGGAVTKVAIVGSKVVLTTTTELTNVATTVTYTQPAVNGLRDTSQNLVATHAASPVTNNA